jgi:hypothetical protein
MGAELGMPRDPSLEVRRESFVARAQLGHAFGAFHEGQLAATALISGLLDGVVGISSCFFTSRCSFLWRLIYQRTPRAQELSWACSQMQLCDAEVWLDWP